MRVIVLIIMIIMIIMIIIIITRMTATVFHHRREQIRPRPRHSGNGRVEVTNGEQRIVFAKIIH